MKLFLVLPNQLFEVKYLKKNNITKTSHKIVLYEHKQYITKYKFNKKKLLLHFGSMDYYKDYLEKKGYQVEYVQYNDSFTMKDYEMFESGDDIRGLKSSKTYENPNYLLTNELREQYRKKTDKYLFNNFYMWSKEQLDIIPSVKSTDKNNREKMSKDMKIPKLLSIPKTDKLIISEQVSRVNKEFKNNYGTTDNFQYPVTHKTARAFLNDFIKNKFKYFGSYQDYMRGDDSYMYHSILSSSINIGLINPLDIMDEIKKYKNKVPMNSYEGYIRQLFWREYQLYCYRTVSYKTELKNPFFGNGKKLNKTWYIGNTENDVVNKTIIKGFNTAYLHHIERLMVMGNYMNLCGIQAEEGMKWFMEFSIDSYEWVMHQNVYDMVFFVTKTMRKPYVSGPNYILNMSDYPKGEWVDDWKSKYDNFVKKHKTKLWPYRYHFPTLTS